ncbi:exosortase system-associated protein, TIGR04073 family [Methylomonas sp. EFPC3]|uniref:exosortase system-associated protein, TIGR04073 family n=1 Tax=Methylomonas TaxID=416 RepID=UPI00112789DE|nr:MULTISPECIES: exosortase system-associated protein, TIGR04073 family [Methylomonas]TPQ29604.1 exosortase system-associated protein, TIGR04073 family [Methylomonas koyamae]WFP50732.1 exosortase system-associated protein, TIGR04073 family [Methylomonas sp. EFPC3]
MNQVTRNAAVLLLSATACFSLTVQADESESYGQTVGRKLSTGLANIATSSLEIPKNIIIINNQSNVIYGFVGGTLKGLLNMGGRIGVGVLDLVSAPVPTQPIVYPLYVWDNFDAETTYGKAFRPSR